MKGTPSAEGAHSGHAARRGTPSGSSHAVVPERKLTPDEINRLELVAYEGPIHVVNTHRHMLQAVAELRGETLLGFDIESRPSFTKGRVYPPAILQLAGRHAVYIFQLRTLGLPPELTAILADARTVKAGVAIGRDVRELRQLREFEPRGFVDLGECAMRRDLKHHGLRGLAAILLGCRISKGPRMTNWERRELPEPALRYAATDAWIGRRIYEAMRDGGLLADIPHSFESPRGPSRKSLWTHARAAIARVIRRPGTPGFTPRERQARA